MSLVRWHITILDQGHMLYLIERERTFPAQGRLMTPYKTTTGFCLELHYWLRGSSSVVIKLRGEEYVETQLVARDTVGNVDGILF